MTKSKVDKYWDWDNETCSMSGRILNNLNQVEGLQRIHWQYINRLNDNDGSRVTFLSEKTKTTGLQTVQSFSKTAHQIKNIRINSDFSYKPNHLVKL